MAMAAIRQSGIPSPVDNRRESSNSQARSNSEESGQTTLNAERNFLVCSSSSLLRHPIRSSMTTMPGMPIASFRKLVSHSLAAEDQRRHSTRTSVSTRNIRRSASSPQNEARARNRYCSEYQHNHATSQRTVPCSRQSVWASAQPARASRAPASA